MTTDTGKSRGAALLDSKNRRLPLGSEWARPGSSELPGGAPSISAGSSRARRGDDDASPANILVSWRSALWTAASEDVRGGHKAPGRALGCGRGRFRKRAGVWPRTPASVGGIEMGRSSACYELWTSLRL